MRIAIPTCEGGVSPLFDVAKQLLLFDVENRREVARTRISLDNLTPDLNACQVIDLETDTLICGAISQPLESFLRSAGVDVIAQTCGGVEEVFHAFVAGSLGEGLFAMPGSQRRRRGWTVPIRPAGSGALHPRLGAVLVRAQRHAVP